jgi:AcrR family transcriptional regulator
MEEPDVKTKILKGAEELFMRYGVRSITMDEIARHLGISKKTLYQYYVDKDDIVASTTQDHLVNEKKQFDQIAEESANSVEELVKLSHCLRENLKGMNPSLLFDLQKYHHKAWNIWIDFKTKFIRESVVRNIKGGIEQGLFRPELNPDILAVVRIETIQLGFDDQLFPPDKFNLLELQTQILEHFIHGLLTDKGRKLFTKYRKEINYQPSRII